MKLKSVWAEVWRFAVLLLALLALSMLAQGLLPKPRVVEAMRDTVDPGRALASMVFLYALYTLLMQYIARRSVRGGWRLYLSLTLLYCGVGSVMMQIETLFFGQAFPLLPPADVLLMILNNLFVGLLFSVLLMLVMRKLHADRSRRPLPAGASLKENLHTVLVAVVVYPLIYFLFGYFVAFGSSAAVDFYSSTTITRNTLALLGFQLLRGGLWALCAILITGVLDRERDIIITLAAGLPLFSGMGLIMENPIMPEAVRYAHGFELIASMLLFGVVLSISLIRNRESVSTA